MSQGEKGYLHVADLGDMTCFVIPMGSRWLEVANFGRHGIEVANLTHPVMNCRVTPAEDEDLLQLLEKLAIIDKNLPEAWAASLGRTSEFAEAERLNRILAEFLQHGPF